MSGVGREQPDETGAWAQREVGDLLAVPLYGSPEWLALEPADGRRMAALIIAAEQWRTGRQVIADVR